MGPAGALRAPDRARAHPPGGACGRVGRFAPHRGRESRRAVPPLAGRVAACGRPDRRVAGDDRRCAERRDLHRRRQARARPRARIRANAAAALPPRELARVLRRASLRRDGERRRRAGERKRDDRRASERLLQPRFVRGRWGRSLLRLFGRNEDDRRAHTVRDEAARMAGVCAWTCDGAGRQHRRRNARRQAAAHPRREVVDRRRPRQRAPVRFPVPGRRRRRGSRRDDLHGHLRRQRLHEPDGARRRDSGREGPAPAHDDAARCDAPARDDDGLPVAHRPAEL